MQVKFPQEHEQRTFHQTREFGETVKHCDPAFRSRSIFRNVFLRRRPYRIRRTVALQQGASTRSLLGIRLQRQRRTETTAFSKLLTQEPCALKRHCREPFASARSNLLGSWSAHVRAHVVCDVDG
ncbi:hypothetical protein IG631_12335 [Alternaria alternata]|nr:hypothetical protein IG631_12335 [Alternaria alternata]